MVEIPNKFLLWFDSLNRESQIAVKAALIKRTKVIRYQLKCEPTAGNVLKVMKTLQDLGIKSEPIRVGKWVVFDFGSQEDRNKVFLSTAFMLEV